MKVALVRAVCVLVFVAALLLMPPIGGPIGVTTWDVAFSLVFAFAVIALTGPGRIFVLSVVFVLTAVVPTAVLFADRWRSIPSGWGTLHVLRPLLPTILSILLIRWVERFARAKNPLPKSGNHGA